MASFVSVPSVAHVGSMEPSAKARGPLDGPGLSVSLHPAFWAGAEKLGDEGFVLEGRGRFLDARSVTEEERAHVGDWAVAEGLASRRTVVVLHAYDDETGAWRSFEFPDAASAEYHSTGYGRTRIERMEDALAPTAALGRRFGRYDMLALPSPKVFDHVLGAYAEADANIDGVWWEEAYDPARASAPRGVIFRERVPEFRSTAVTWQGLVAFEQEATADADTSRPRFLIA
jgi:hypothetical protein